MNFNINWENTSESNSSNKLETLKLTKANTKPSFLDNLFFRSIIILGLIFNFIKSLEYNLIFSAWVTIFLLIAFFIKFTIKIESYEDYEVSADDLPQLLDENHKYKFAYDAWEEHSKTYWISSEVDVNEDRDLFTKAEKWMQNLILSCAAFLMHGDDFILSEIGGNLMSTIKQRYVNAFLAQQNASENHHSVVYAKMLNLSDYGSDYLTKSFFNHRVNKYKSFINKYKARNVAECSTVITVIERLCFPFPFLVLQYARVAGFISNVGLLNEMVMRDEYCHYKFHRKLVSISKNKMSFDRLNQMLNDLEKLVISDIEELVGDNKTKDNRFNAEIAINHYRHILHLFRVENSLYENSKIELEMEEKYGRTPAESYMINNEMEIKSNLMEIESTTYNQGFILSKL